MAKFPRIPHPWWHWFFTDIVARSIYDEWQDHVCTFCHKEYRVHNIEPKMERVDLK